jgi:hypothetical protein
MLAGAGTVDGRAAGALINALRLAESFDISTDERLEEGCLAIKNACGLETKSRARGFGEDPGDQKWPPSDTGSEQ